MLFILIYSVSIWVSNTPKRNIEIFSEIQMHIVLHVKEIAWEILFDFSIQDVKVISSWGSLIEDYNYQKLILFEFYNFYLN